MKDFEKLYYLHKEELYRYLLGLTHHPEQAGDLMQETFLQAMLSIGRFRQQSSVRTWLFAIGRNLWLKELRKHRETVEYDDLLETYTRQTLEETAGEPGNAAPHQKIDAPEGRESQFGFFHACFWL